MPTKQERSASLEIISKVPLLAISRLPIWKKKTKNRMLLSVANNLSKESFLMSASYLTDMIEVDKRESCKFRDSWEQTYAMVRGEFSRFYDYKDAIHEKVKAYRQKLNLMI